MTDLTIQPFPAFELFVKQLVVDNIDDADDSNVGGDLAYEATDAFYIRIKRFAGSTNKLEGRFIFDVEAFAANWQVAESLASSIEALLLGSPHRVTVGDQLMIFDEVIENVGIFEMPWDDDTVTRLGATYSLVARRR